MDTAIFDFLIGNMDRHHYETFQHFGSDTFVLLYDHGRGFGKSKYDCTSCLAPLRQCCAIRLSTLTKLAKLYVGPSSLSQVLRQSMTSDPLSPILWEPHLDALDRRLGKVIKVVNDCIAAGKSREHVIINDGVT
ncbi:unnamed protein product [Lymnaea stagnalis]|uniref:FAM20 C-terminal domain-containing protein n=1 Tax=Lymnaea stagnalis TaxID=6523 RepID=A0AAV2I8N9_LYMST